MFEVYESLQLGIIFFLKRKESGVRNRKRRQNRPQSTSKIFAMPFFFSGHGEKVKPGLRTATLSALQRQEQRQEDGDWAQRF